MQRLIFSIALSLVLGAIASPALAQADAQKAYEQAKTALEAGNLAEARDLAKEAAETDPKNAEVFLLLGKAHYGLGELDEAIEAWKQTLALAPQQAYAAKMAYAETVRICEVWHEFHLARDYRGIMAGLNLRQLFPQNVMVADSSGNIYYQRTGRVPKRPAGYDWSRPVDGV